MNSRQARDTVEYHRRQLMAIRENNTMSAEELAHQYRRGLEHAVDSLHSCAETLELLEEDVRIGHKFLETIKTHPWMQVRSE